MSSANSLGPKYGEKGAQIKNYRQIHQPPAKLQRAIGNDRMCMEMCPSSGLHLDKLGERADPLPPKRKRRYEQQKARTKAVKAGAIQSRKRQVEGRRKTVRKRQLSLVQNTTPPPGQPPPVSTIFRSAPLPPAPQLATSESGTPIDALTVHSPIPPGRRYTSSHSMSPVTLRSCHSAGASSTAPELVYQPPHTANGVFNATYLQVYAKCSSGHSSDLALGHGLSPISTPSLQSDGGTPTSTVELPRSPRSLGTWADGPTPAPQSPSLPEQQNRIQSAAEEDRDSEGIFNAVYQSYFIPRSSWSRPSPTLAVDKGHSDTQLSIVPETHQCLASQNTVQYIPDRSHYPSPPHSATMSPPDLRVPESWPTATAVRSSTHQDHRSLSQHPYVTATATSGVVSGHQHRGPVWKGVARATGTQPGVHRPERATFHHQHTSCPYPSHSDRVAVGHAHANRSPTTAERSAIARSAGYGTTLPISAHQAQVWQHDGSTSVSSSDSSRGHSGHPNSVPLARTIPTHLVNSVNQLKYSAPTTMSTQCLQPTRASQSAYSDLADALINPHSTVPLVEQAGVGAATLDAPLYTPHIADFEITSPAATAPELLAHWHNDLPVGPNSILTNPLMEPSIDAVVVPGTPRAHAFNNIGMARTFEGGFEECEPFCANIMPPLLGTDIAIGQNYDETYLDASLAGSQSDLSQQFLTTSTWQETRDELTHPYPSSTVPNSTFGFAAAAMQGSSEW